VIEEMVLRYRTGPPEVMAAQLDYLLEAAVLPGVSLGVIPPSVPRSVWPLEAFTMFDDASLAAANRSAKARRPAFPLQPWGRECRLWHLP
jgi:Domain of unknown function (DUF5753)